MEVNIGFRKVGRMASQNRRGDTQDLELFSASVRELSPGTYEMFNLTEGMDDMPENRKALANAREGIIAPYCKRLRRDYPDGSIIIKRVMGWREDGTPFIGAYLIKK